MATQPIEMRIQSFSQLYNQLTNWIRKAHTLHTSKAEMCLLLGYPYHDRCKLTAENLIMWRYPVIILYDDTGYRELFRLRSASLVRRVNEKCIARNHANNQRKKHQKYMQNKTRQCGNCAFAKRKTKDNRCVCRWTKATMQMEHDACSQHLFGIEKILMQRRCRKEKERMRYEVQ